VENDNIGIITENCDKKHAPEVPPKIHKTQMEVRQMRKT